MLINMKQHEAVHTMCKMYELQDRLSTRLCESCNKYKYEDKIQEQSKMATRI